VAEFERPISAKVETDGRFSNGGADRAIAAIRRSLILFGLVLVVGTVAVISVTRDEPDWEPLGPFEEQTVLLVTDDFVSVVGTKCYSETVTVTGSLSWRSIEPLGTIVNVFEGQADRVFADLDDGCLTQTFENSVPAEVLAHPEVTVWVINGVETPVADVNGSRDGLLLTWTTEPFIYPPVSEE